MKKVLLVSADRSDTNGVPINLGDALLSDAVASSLIRAGFDVTVCDFGASRTTGEVPRVFVDGLFGLARSIRSADVVVIGGGTLFQDDTPGRIFAGLPRLLFVTSTLARLFRRKVAFFAVGCDPIARILPRLLLRIAAGAGRTWVRDVRSQERCRALLGRDVELAGDASLLFAAKIAGMAAQAKAAPPLGLILALNGRESKLLRSVTVRELMRSHSRVHFLAMSQGGHVDDAMVLVEDARRELTATSHGITWKEAVGLIAGSSVVVASRMHAMYIAAMSGTSMVAVGASPKVEAFAEEFGVPLMGTIPSMIVTDALADQSALRAATLRVEIGFQQLVRYLAA